ncbi:protein translocase subunit SecF [Helicovermis profundi]|uniref:Protein-export membrane protein SecF n=1 Tax=Helicovermis profundi TaxID=3065157 RepID=A0AAU9E8S3_9FIRM|nr:protein translocase subunit SecF [Clostridia bacterium S502]
MNIVGKYKIWFGISLAVILIGLIIMATTGLNYGIDFTGGTMMQIDLGQTAPVDEVQSVIKDFNLNAEIVHAGQEKHEIIIKTKASISNDERIKILAAFVEKYKLDKDTVFRSVEQFGPSIGKEIQNKALLAILAASVCMLIYITFRFEYVYGVSAITALLHDVLVLLAVYAIFRIPVNSSFIAAILTIVGYSINDTIVVFDRVRENMRRRKKEPFMEVANNSILQTITRSLNTSLTTLVVIGSLYFLGVEQIKDFAFPLMSGVIVGTYSSIFIASPIWALWKTKKEKVQKHYSKA